MKTYVNESKSNVLLTELVIVILFFALTAATAMQLFVGSHLKSLHNTRQQRAAITCQDWVEQLRGVEDMDGYLVSHGFTDKGDGEYELVESDKITVAAKTGEEPLSAGVLHFCTFNVLERGQAEPLCELSVAAYIPAEEVAN